MYGFVMRSSNDFKMPSTFLFLYKTLVRSQLEYAVPIWSPYYDKYKNYIEMVQKKFLRSMHYRFHRTRSHYRDLLTQYNILNLESRRTFLMVMTLYGICNNKFDCADLTNNLCYVVPRTIMRREVRVPRLFHTEKCRTNAGERAPLRRLVVTYNSLFTDIDIFALSQLTFRKKVLASLTGTP